MAGDESAMNSPQRISMQVSGNEPVGNAHFRGDVDRIIRLHGAELGMENPRQREFTPTLG